MVTLNKITVFLESHTKEDADKLIMFVLAKGLRKRKAYIDKQCEKGIHGFNVKSQVGYGGIHSWCTNCGRSWSVVDRPMSI